MRNVLHRVYGDGVCLNRIDFGSCWPVMDGWQETDFTFYMANALRDSLLSRLGRIGPMTRWRYRTLAVAQI